MRHYMRMLRVVSRRTTRRLLPANMGYDVAQEDVLSELVNMSGDDNTVQLASVILMRRFFELSRCTDSGVEALVSELLVRLMASMVVHNCVSILRDFIHHASAIEPPDVL